MGDLNAKENEKHRRGNITVAKSRIENKQMKDMIKAVSLRDAWEEKNKNEDGHTFFYKGGSSRIDRIYFKGPMSINEIKTKATTFTDHQALIGEIAFDSRLSKVQKRKRELETEL